MFERAHFKARLCNITNALDWRFFWQRHHHQNCINDLLLIKLTWLRLSGIFAWIPVVDRWIDVEDFSPANVTLLSLLRIDFKEKYDVNLTWSKMITLECVGPTLIEGGCCSAATRRRSIKRLRVRFLPTVIIYFCHELVLLVHSALFIQLGSPRSWRHVIYEKLLGFELQKDVLLQYYSSFSYSEFWVESDTSFDVFVFITHRLLQ